MLVNLRLLRLKFFKSTDVWVRIQDFLSISVFLFYLNGGEILSFRDYKGIKFDSFGISRFIFVNIVSWRWSRGLLIYSFALFIRRLKFGKICGDWLVEKVVWLHNGDVVHVFYWKIYDPLSDFINYFPFNRGNFVFLVQFWHYLLWLFFDFRFNGRLLVQVVEELIEVYYFVSVVACKSWSIELHFWLSYRFFDLLSLGSRLLRNNLAIQVWVDDNILEGSQLVKFQSRPHF